MPVCSYVVVPRAGEKERLREVLSAMPGCEVVPADNADLLLLVTTTAAFEADAALRRRVEALPSLQALWLTFGEVDPAVREERGDVAPPGPTQPTGERVP